MHTLGIREVYKKHLLWDLKSVLLTYFGLLGPLGIRICVNCVRRQNLLPAPEDRLLWGGGGVPLNLNRSTQRIPKPWNGPRV